MVLRQRCFANVDITKLYESRIDTFRHVAYDCVTGNIVCACARERHSLAKASAPKIEKKIAARF